jgi:ComF family protein
MRIPSINEYSNGFLSLFFPNLCHLCQKRLFDFEEALCLQCQTDLPYANRQRNIFNNAVTDILRPRFSISSAFSLLEFSKGNKVQQLLHGIKYRDNPALAQHLGEIIGHQWKERTDVLPDVLIPVPLHPKKMKKRGFNQSERLARGISEVLQIPLDTSSLKRVLHATSQTSLGRRERWKNIGGAFVSSSRHLSVKHIALIDDMITTGSTLEACVRALETENVSVLSLAFEP